MVLMKSSVPYRRRNNLYNIKISDVMQEVGGCMLQLVEGARDREGRVVLLVQPQNYTPAASPPLNVVRAVMYLLDKYRLPPTPHIYGAADVAPDLSLACRVYHQGPGGRGGAAEGLHGAGRRHGLQVLQLRPQDAPRPSRRHYLALSRYAPRTQLFNVCVVCASRVCRVVER